MAPWTAAKAWLPLRAIITPYADQFYAACNKNSSEDSSEACCTEWEALRSLSTTYHVRHFAHARDRSRSFAGDLPVRNYETAAFEMKASHLDPVLRIPATIADFFLFLPSWLTS
jgi:hypothetical protein